MSEIWAVGKVKKWLMLASIMTGFNSVSLWSNLKFFSGKYSKSIAKRI